MRKFLPLFLIFFLLLQNQLLGSASKKEVSDLYFDLFQPPLSGFSLKQNKKSNSIFPVRLNLKFNLKKIEPGLADYYSASWKEAEQKTYFKKRAFLELSTLLSFSTIRYWIQESINKVDWDYNLNFKDQSKRFLSFQAVRFDSNAFSLNWTHALAGGLYFNIYRSNQRNFYQSALASFLASSFWEYVTEFKEVISINDQIFTPIGGISIGEVFYQFYRFFSSSRKNSFNNLCSSFFGFISRLNQLLFSDREKLKNEFYDQNGFWANLKHDFRLTLQNSLESNQFSGALIDFQLDDADNVVQDVTDFSRFLICSDFSPSRLEQFKLQTEIAFLGGYYNLKNWKTYLGLGTSFELRYRYFLDQQDRHAYVHLIGPHAGLQYEKSGFSYKNRSRFWLDFSLCNSLAISEWKKNNNYQDIKTTLKDWNYYYAVGYSFLTEQELAYRMFFLRGALFFAQSYSIQGRDRFPENLKNDFALQDKRLEGILSLGCSLSRHHLELAYNREWFQAEGRILPLIINYNQRRDYLSLSFRF